MNALRTPTLSTCARAELHALLCVALEAIPCPAFAVRRTGECVAANASGREWLAEAPGRAVRLAAAARGGPSDDLVVSHPHSNVGPYLVLRVELARESSERVSGEWGFTRRERAVHARLLEGETNRVIAAQLGIAERTVETHLTRMFKKAGVESRAELVARTRR